MNHPKLRSLRVFLKKQFMMFKKYILSLFSVLTFFISYSQCSGPVNIDYINPGPSATNTYPPNSTVEVCVTMTGWDGTATGSNWLEGFGLNLGVGWISVTPLVFPEDCDAVAGTTNSWLWVPSVTSSETGNTAGPGFFFEGPSGPLDGDPGNDFGDYGTTCNWSFCFLLTADSLPNVDLSMSVSVYSDGDMGSWGNPDCVGSDPPIVVFPPGTETDCLTFGCTDNLACNYDANISCDDGSCVYPGCIDNLACNFDPNAACDDGSCVYPGCNDPTACNFNPLAGCNDGTCSYFSIGTITHNLVVCPDTSCTGSQKTYSVTGQQTSQYVWQISNGGTLTSDGLNTCEVSWGFTPGTYEISVYEITEAGCFSDTVYCNVEVITPQIIFESESYTICLDETLPLSAIPPFGEWDSQYMVGNSFVGTMAGSFSVGYTGEIYNCSVKDFITINVKSKFERPVITKADTLVDLCEDLNKQFYSVARREGVIYIWDVENVLSVNETNEMAVVWYDTTLNYIVSVYGVDTLNCKSEKTEFYVRTVACSRVYAPNSFTPDNDGVNDIFRVSGIGIYEPRLLIFDKWGNAFFETNDLRRGWNGDNGTGYYSEDGVYNWVIFYKDAQGVPKENNGYVILIR